MTLLLLPEHRGFNTQAGKVQKEGEAATRVNGSLGQGVSSPPTQKVAHVPMGIQIASLNDWVHELSHVSKLFKTKRKYTYHFFKTKHHHKA